MRCWPNALSKPCSRSPSARWSAPTARVPGSAVCRRGHGQARWLRDDGGLRSRPDRGLRLCRRTRRQSDGLEAPARDPVLHAPDAALISALASQTAEGTLYEVDMRLRPSGQKGPVATQLSSFIDYQQREAWTWEHLALTRARVISGPPDLHERRRAAIRQVLTLPRDRAKIAADVRDMRARIEKEKGTKDLLGPEAGARRPRRSGVHRPVPATRARGRAPRHVLSPNTVTALTNLSRAGLLAGRCSRRAASRRAPVRTTSPRSCACAWMAPLCPEKAPDGLKALLARAGRGARFCPPGGGFDGPAGRSRWRFSMS